MIAHVEDMEAVQREGLESSVLSRKRRSQRRPDLAPFAPAHGDDARSSAPGSLRPSRRRPLRDRDGARHGDSRLAHRPRRIETRSPIRLRGREGARSPLPRTVARAPELSANRPVARASLVHGVDRIGSLPPGNPTSGSRARRRRRRLATTLGGPRESGERSQPGDRALLREPVALRRESSARAQDPTREVLVLRGDSTHRPGTLRDSRTGRSTPVSGFIDAATARCTSSASSTSPSTLRVFDSDFVVRRTRSRSAPF